MKPENSLLSLLILVMCLFFLEDANARNEYVQPHIVYNTRNINFESLKDAVEYERQFMCYYEAAEKQPYCAMTQASPATYSGSGNIWSIPYYYTDGSGQSSSPNDAIAVYTVCPLGWSTLQASQISQVQCRRTQPVKAECDPCRGKSNEPIPNIGNPIVPSTMVKRQVETDYASSSGHLIFTRTYQSDSGNWTNNYQSRAIDYNRLPGGDDGRCYLDQQALPLRCYPYITPSQPYNLVVYRGNNNPIYFGTSTDYSPTTDIDDRAYPLIDAGGNVSGWNIYNAANDTTETYSLDGTLRTITYRSGQNVALVYSDLTTPKDIAPYSGLLISVLDVFGHTLSFKYNTAGQMVAMIDPDHHEYLYGYDNLGNLVAVTYPDGGVKQYIYNEQVMLTGMPNATRTLTGIVDENNTRFANYGYTYYQATSTEHAGGVGHFDVSVNSITRVVKDPLGTTRTYEYMTSTSLPDTYKNTQIKQPGPTGSGTIYQSTNYDAHGNVSSITDFNGNQTTFTYDLTRNLETSRIEGVGTATARTISTSWDPTLRLRAKVAEPKKLTTFVYDGMGRMLSRTEQATSDATGAQAFGATPIGTARMWSYTYNGFGQVLTETGPRTGIANITTYTYDDQGNLATLTNPLGHVTTYTNYNQSGKVGRVVAPNGLVTDIAYDARDRVVSYAVSDGAVTETTGFNYDKAGQLTKATFPDGSSLGYTYDPAHRLTNVADSTGNSIAYTLDNAGNRISEQVTGPDGALSRQISRMFGALNNLTQTTGAAQ